MATIESYQTASGQRRYMVRFRTPDRRQSKKRGFTTKRDAQAFAATVEVEKMRGEYVAPKLGHVTIGSIGPDWLARKEIDLKPSAYRSLETSWRVHVEPHWGRARLTDVDIDHVERWVTTMRKTSGATVVLRNYGVLCGILDAAIKQGRLARNPARGADNLPSKPRKARTYLTHAQVEQLAAHAGQHRVLVYLLAYSGLRWGEAIALRVRHLDLIRRRVDVVANVVQVNMTMHPGTPKNGEARSVPIPEFLALELGTACTDLDRDDLVFPGADGEYLRRPVSHSGWFVKAVERSGVPRLTVHDLRHTAASLAVSAGANVLALQRMLGHKSAAMTLDTYSDLLDTDLDAVADALGTARAQNVPTTCPQAAPANTDNIIDLRKQAV